MINRDIFRCVQTVEAGILYARTDGKIESGILQTIVQCETVCMGHECIGVAKQAVEQGITVQ